MVLNQPGPVFTPGQLLTAGNLNALSAMLNAIQAPWTAYTPVLTAATTNPTPGSGGSTYGRYQQFGKTIFCEGQFQFGSSGAAFGSGAYMLSLPVTANASGTAPIAGTLACNPNAGATWGPCLPFVTNAGAQVYWWGPSTSTSAMWSGIGQGGVGGVSWAASGLIRWNFVYEAL